MPSDSTSKGWILAVPTLFATEVGVWLAVDAAGVADVLFDPVFEDFGRMFDLESILMGLGAAAIVLTGLVSWLGLARRARALSVSLVQLPGFVAVGAWWIGGPTEYCAAVVALSTLGAWWVSAPRSAEPSD